jgi:hypothetical protein
MKMTIIVKFMLFYDQREGADVTIKAYSQMVGYALKVCLPKDLLYSRYVLFNRVFNHHLLRSM